MRDDWEEDRLARWAKLGLTRVQADSFVFGTVNNELRGPNDATAHWSRLLEKLAQDSPSLPRVTFKGLKHSHVTPTIQQKAIEQLMNYFPTGAFVSA